MAHGGGRGDTTDHFEWSAAREIGKLPLCDVTGEIVSSHVQSTRP